MCPFSPVPIRQLKEGDRITMREVRIGRSDGTIVLDCDPGQGAGADPAARLHLCALHNRQLAADVPQAFRRLDPAC